MLRYRLYTREKKGQGYTGAPELHDAVLRFFMFRFFVMSVLGSGVPHSSHRRMLRLCQTCMKNVLRVKTKTKNREGNIRDGPES